MDAGDLGVTAEFRLTTPDRRDLLRLGGRPSFQRRAPRHPAVVVDPERGYQSLLGCGASITDSSAALLSGLSDARRDEAMAQLFSPVEGIGLSYLRQPVGSSAFVAGPRYYTCDDVPSGQTDFRLEHFSVEHDEEQILPLIRQARRLNPLLKVMATAWSAPAWMKTNGSLVGGELIDSPRYVQAYADYLVRFVQAYERAGVPVDALTVQNEPQNRNPDTPGMYLGVAQEKRVIQALGPALRNAGLDTKILAFDHNWSIHPHDVAATPPDQVPEADYPYDILADPATARWVAGTAFHCYYGDPAAQSRLHRKFPDKDVYFTECSGSHGPADSDAKIFSDTLRWHARNVIIGATRNWARTVITWNLALDPSGGPHIGGCTDFSGVITVEDGDAFTRNAEYYALGHLSGFARPGAVRIASGLVGGGVGVVVGAGGESGVEECEDGFGEDGFGEDSAVVVTASGAAIGAAVAVAAAGLDEVISVAFRNEDGTVALILHNQGDDARTVDVVCDGRALACVLPGGALATLTWAR